MVPEPDNESDQVRLESLTYNIGKKHLSKSFPFAVNWGMLMVEGSRCVEEAIRRAFTVANVEGG